MRRGTQYVYASYGRKSHVTIVIKDTDATGPNHGHLAFQDLEPVEARRVAAALERSARTAEKRRSRGGRT